MQEQRGHADRCALVVPAIEQRWSLPQGTVLSRDRRRPAVVARHTAFYALSRIGLSPAEIARTFRLNHSTVVHGLRQAEQHPEWQEYALSALALTAPGGTVSAIAVWLERLLPRELAPADRRAVSSYASALVGMRVPASWGIAGMRLLRQQPALRRHVEEALRRCDLDAYSSLIDLHAQQLARRA